MKKIITLSIVCLVSGQLFAQKAATSASKDTKVQPVATRVEAVAPATSIAPTAPEAMAPNTAAAAKIDAPVIAPGTVEAVSSTLADAVKVAPVAVSKETEAKLKEEARLKAAQAQKQKTKD